MHVLGAVEEFNSASTEKATLQKGVKPGHPLELCKGQVNPKQRSCLEEKERHSKTLAVEASVPNSRSCFNL